MFNPFVKFDLKMVEGFRRLNRHYLVTQSYGRGRLRYSTETKESLLISDYDDKGLALVHYKALMSDRYAAIIDLSKDVHRFKLMEMLHANSKYIIYVNLVTSQKEVEGKLNTLMKDKLRKYIIQHTNWRISKEASVVARLKVIFGEFFVLLKHGSQQIQVKLEEIEKM